MNMTFDGWLIVPTEHGYLVAISRDFAQHHVIRLRHSEGAEEKATKPTGYGWVRNGVAVDDEGGLYIASQEHMHKVVWDGEKLSNDPADGAWTARYLNEWGHGSGATPSLMGFGDEDRFVVITDGQTLMNVVLFWRDAIPDDWTALPGAPDRRIAGMQPADMGDPELEAIQSEQSVVVAGYGALVVNNVPRNAPWYLPSQAGTGSRVALIAAGLGQSGGELAELRADRELPEPTRLPDRSARQPLDPRSARVGRRALRLPQRDRRPALQPLLLGNGARRARPHPLRNALGARAASASGRGGIT
jgi:hypothetical protein